MKFFSLLTAACLFASLAAVLPGCSSSGNTSSTEAIINPHAEAQTLMRLDDEWSAAAGQRDVEKVASFYADDAVAYPPGEPVSKGKSAAKAVWASYFAEPSFKISWKSNDARVSDCGGLGYTAGTYTASYKGPDGKMVDERGKFLCVWRKQRDGTWKASRDMWNTDSK